MSSSQPVSVSQWCAHSRAVVFHTLHRGQRDTSLYPYLVNFSTLYFYLLFSQPRSLPILPRHCSSQYSSVTAATTALSLAPVRSIPAFSHHCIPTYAPGGISVSSHGSIMDHVAMNCVTVFCLLQIYSSIASITAFSLAAAAEVYYHFPSCRLHGILPINRRTTWSWNPPPSNRPMREVTPKISTNWTMSLKENPDTRGADPSLLIICVSLRNTARALARFLTTSG